MGDFASSLTETRLEVLLEKLVLTVTEFMQVERSSLFLHDSVNDELWSQVAHSARARTPGSGSLLRRASPERSSIPAQGLTSRMPMQTCGSTRRWT